MCSDPGAVIVDIYGGTELDPVEAVELAGASRPRTRRGIRGPAAVGGR